LYVCSQTAQHELQSLKAALAAEEGVRQRAEAELATASARVTVLEAGTGAAYSHPLVFHFRFNWKSAEINNILVYVLNSRLCAGCIVLLYVIVPSVAIAVDAFCGR
jgi:hypothetical protein